MKLTRSETRMMLVALDLLEADFRKYAVGSPADLQSLDDVSNLQDKLIHHLNSEGSAKFTPERVY